KPMSDKAHAAASPARPPPAMATVGWDGVEVIRSKAAPRPRSCQAFDKALSQDAQLFPRAQGDLGAEDVVLLLGDFSQQAAVDRDQHPQRRLAILGDVRDQSIARGVELTRAVGFERQ